MALTGLQQLKMAVGWSLTTGGFVSIFIHQQSEVA
jgi:hypothetical protein